MAILVDSVFSLPEPLQACHVVHLQLLHTNCSRCCLLALTGACGQISWCTSVVIIGLKALGTVPCGMWNMAPGNVCAVAGFMHHARAGKTQPITLQTSEDTGRIRLSDAPGSRSRQDSAAACLSYKDCAPELSSRSLLDTKHAKNDICIYSALNVQDSAKNVLWRQHVQQNFRTNGGTPATTAIQSSMPQTTQPACASSVQTAAEGYGTAAFEGGSDFEFEDEVMADVSENPCGDDPCTSIGGGVATFELVPQPAPHRVSGCVSQILGDGTCGDSCSLLAASLQKLECTGGTKKPCTTPTPRDSSIKRVDDDIEWLHNATASAAREVCSCVCDVSIGASTSVRFPSCSTRR
jgi:hypothetical protein